MLDVGAVGLVLLLASLIGSARRALALIIKQDTFVSLFPMIFISYFVLSNITETAALTYNTILWMLLVTLAIQLRGGEIGCVGKVAMKRPISRSNIRGPRL
jgi:O-antigen ligase